MLASVLVLGVMVGLISFSVGFFGGEVAEGPLQVSMTLATLFALTMVYYYGFRGSLINHAISSSLNIVNLLIRPIVLLLARPLGWVALLVIGFLVKGLSLWITAWLLPGFEVSFWAGIFGGIVIAFFNAILTGILDVDETGSWYQNRIERLARAQPFASAGEPGRGLMMLEIDGLSYWHIRKALDDGLLPTVQEVMIHDQPNTGLIPAGSNYKPLRIP